MLKRLLAISVFALTAAPASAQPAPPSSTADKAEPEARIAVLRFRGPEDVSFDSSLGYKLKSGQLTDDYKDDFDDLGSALQKSFVAELNKTQGNLARVQPGKAPDRDTIDDVVKQANTAYVLTGVIDKIRFEGNTLVPNYYELTLTAKLISRADGSSAWSVHHKLFARMFKTRGKKDPAQIFEEMMAPHVAEKLSGDVAQAAGAAASKN